MQSVVRSSLIGLLAIAGLTACGDKVTNVQEGNNVVHSVTVTPAVITNLQVGGSFTLAASVDAGSGVTNRTVTWTSSDPSIASVDPATGKVTGVKVGGPVTITAASAADATVKGAALVTVIANGGSAVPLVTISTINQTVCGIGGCNSVPANLLNVAGQVDVTLNVEANGASLSKITGVLKCGNDSIVVVQNVAAASIISADEAAAPVTMSFNTAAFNSTTGAPALKNGQCTVSGFATTTSGTQSAINTTSFTLNNIDMAVVTVTSTNSATDPLNKPWIGGGPLTITALPVMYSGRTPVAATVGFNWLVANQTTNATQPSGTTVVGGVGATSQTLTALTAGAFSATWTNGPTAPSVQGFGATAITPTVTISDNSGATTNAVGSVTVKGGATTNTPANFQFNLDDQKPAPGTFSVINNADQGIAAGGLGYVGTAFRFVADSASGYRGPNAVAGNQAANTDNGGVDKVTVVFQFRTNGSGTYAAVTNTTPITESATAQAYELRMITADALGNADTTGNASSVQNTTIKFGVDKTAATVTVAAAPANQATTTAANGLGNYTFTITDGLSGTGPALVAQVRQWNGLTSVNSANEGRINTNVAAPPGATYFGVGTSATATQQPCYIGRFNATQAAAGANAIPVFSATGAALGFCTPVVYTLAGNSTIGATQGVDGYWTTTVVAQDVAANQAAPVTRTVLEDVTAPTVTNIDPPPTAVGNSTVTFPATVTDNATASVGDIVGSWITETFAGPGVSLRFNSTAGPGVAFDNVLTNSTQVTPAIPNFIKNLQVAATALAPVAGNNASSVTVTALGAAGNTGSLLYTFQPGAPQLVAGATSTFSATGNCVVNGTGTCPSVAGWAIQAPANANITNCPNDVCANNATPTQPTSITLTATAQGLTQTYTNPFATGVVQFWYRPTGNAVWYLIGNAAAGVSRDNNTNRFWDYTITFNPPNFTPDQVALTTAGMTIDVAAIGINAAGDAVMTATTVLTVANP
jgi:hypothetical protein